MSEAEKKQKRGRRFSVPDSYEVFLSTLEKQNDPEFKAKLHERMWKIEGLFAEAKTLHGMYRARYRRIQKVQIQVYLTATVQNVKRLVKASVLDIIRKLADLGKLWEEMIFWVRVAIFSKNWA